MSVIRRCPALGSRSGCKTPEAELLTAHGKASQELRFDGRRSQAFGGCPRRDIPRLQTWVQLSSNAGTP
jgi:hypothetical protein